MAEHSHPSRRGVGKSWFAGSCAPLLIGAAGIAGALSGSQVVAHAAAAPVTWSINTSPDRGDNNNQITGISCVTSAFCVAVGDYEPGFPREQVLIETWNGSTWSITPSPNANSVDDWLTGISCASTTSCVAVGTLSTGGASGPYFGFSELWDGHTWTVALGASPAAGTPPYAFNSVACTSSTMCVAAGSSGASGVNQPLVESWDGSAWTFDASPPPPLSQSGALAGAACNTSTSCFAVGSYATQANGNQPLIESFDGTSWSIATGAVSGTNLSLESVSCITGFCMTVGQLSAGPHAFAETWSGSSWAAAASPAEGDMFGVSCWTSTRCMATGYEGGPAADLWNGVSWSATSVSSQGSSDATLLAVACTSSVFCLAGGWDNAPPNGYPETLAELWTGGAWTLVTAPDQDLQNNVLSGVSCLSATNCLAVGGSTSLDGEQTLMESWNGVSWSLVSSPTQLFVDSHLSSVSCTSSLSCVAAGWTGDSPTKRPLIEQIVGGNWSTMAIPTQGTGDNPLTGVSCTSANSCVAVGYSTSSSGAHATEIESWNGTAWTLVASPNPAGGGVLSSVSCVAFDTCVAVGSAQTSSGTSTLIESTSPRSGWVIVTSPNEGNGTDQLNGVSCTTATNCTAVGDFENASAIAQTMVEDWNGGTWAVVASQNNGNASNVLNSVSCVTATSCIAVGADSINSIDQNLVEQWNGMNWVFVVSPNQGPSANSLDSVSCPTSASCAAMGSWMDTGFNQTPALQGSAPTDSQIQLDDTNPGVAFDTWVGVTDATASGGTYRTSSTKAAKTTFAFSGTAITWMTREGPDQGTAAVTIDGVKRANVKLYATTEQRFAETYSGLAAGSHTIVITVTGTEVAQSTGTSIAVDSFVVGTTVTQDSSDAIKYDSWRGNVTASAFDGADHVSATKGATCTLTFTGTSVQWITVNGKAYGMATVAIDGVGKGTVDLYTPQLHTQSQEIYGGLSAGAHTIVITVLGTKNSSSTSANVVVDGFGVTTG